MSERRTQAIYGNQLGGLFRDETSVLPARIAAVGSGMPPFNSGVPPICFAFIAACDTSGGDPELPGYGNAFAEGLLYPYNNAYFLAPNENMAQCGYKITFQTDQNLVCTQALYSALCSGWTVDQARFRSYIAYKGDNKPLSATDYMAVWGQFQTRVHGVYTGVIDSLPITDWYMLRWANFGFPPGG